MPPQEKIYIEYMGCPQRALDARKLADYFLKNGQEVVRSAKSADRIIFISCACKKNDENTAVRRIRELSQYKTKMIVGGCLGAINKNRLDKIFQGPTIGTSKIDQIDQLFPDFPKKYREMADPNILYPRNKWQLIRLFSGFFRLNLGFLRSVIDYFVRKSSKKYWFIRAGWGCISEHCTYCSVWKAVGELKSKPVEDCVRELQEGVRRGHKNMLITADNLGAYGLDIHSTLPELLSRLIAIEGDYKIEIENCHPRWIIKYLDSFLPVLRSGKIRLIRCAIQSGNDRILGLMNRGHTGHQAEEALLKVRKACPEIELHTQIIVGFPSETEEEFEETLARVKTIGFRQVFISGYSRSPIPENTHLISKEILPDNIQCRVSRAVEFFTKNRIACFVYSVG